MEAVLEKLESQTLSIHQESRIKQAFAQYKTIFNLTRQLNETQDPEEILARIINIVGEVVRSRAIALLLKEKYSTDFYLYRDFKMKDANYRQLKWVERSGYIEWACNSQQVMLIPPEEFEQLKSPIVLIPLYSGKETLGVLVIFLEADLKTITTHETDLLSLIGMQAAVALENAHLYQNMSLQNQAMNSMKSFLESSLESMADGLLAIDLENRITLFNSSAAKLFGPSSVEAIGSNYQEIFPPDFARFLDHALEMTLTIGTFEDEIEYQHPITKRKFPLSVRMSPLKNTTGEQIGAIAVCRDVSERQELIHLRKLEQMKNEFISSVSHELRTPLTAIKSFTEILLNFDQNDADTRKEFLGIIDKETDRLIELINDLLDLNKLSQEDFKLDIATVNIQDTLKQALNAVHVLAQKKSITLVNRLDQRRLMVAGDFKRLVQVFVNLIGNAIKFSPEGSKIEIWSEPIRGKRLVDKSDFLMIAVKDQGIGIPEEAQKVIFEKFKQVTTDPSTKPEGSGLGLSICKRIVESLGGNIWVESEEGKGSTFYFTLPQAARRPEEGP